MGFAIALHPIVERIIWGVSNLLINVWYMYLDDGTLCGSPEDLVKDFSIIEKDGLDKGFILKRMKSLLIIPEKNDFSLNPLPSDITVSREGYVLLGCPIGSLHLLCLHCP